MEKKMNSYPMKLITTNASAATFAKKKINAKIRL
jgi:hypothetical protein